MTIKSNHSTGSYVALELSSASRIDVHDFSEHILQLKDQVNPEYLHSTIIYSETPVPQSEYLDRFNIEATATPVRYAVFDTKVGKKCLTVIVDCPIARDINAMLTALGATSRFSPYTCHLTLSYDYQGDVNTLPLIPFKLTYKGLIIKPLDINFIPPSK